MKEGEKGRKKLHKTTRQDMGSTFDFKNGWANGWLIENRYAKEGLTMTGTRLEGK